MSKKQYYKLNLNNLIAALYSQALVACRVIYRLLFLCCVNDMGPRKTVSLNIGVGTTLQEQHLPTV